MQNEKQGKQLAGIVDFPLRKNSDDSETSKQALRYLNIHATNATNAFVELSRSHFTRISDYILTNLISNSASRPAATYNMTLREFKLPKNKVTILWFLELAIKLDILQQQ